MMERESTFRTLAVAAGVALFCSLLVSTTVFLLRPMQLAYRSIEQDRAILEAAGMISSDEPLADRDIVTRYLDFDELIVDLDAGTYVAAGALTDYDYRLAINDPEQNREIKRDEDIAGLGHRPLQMPVYVLRSGQAIDRIVLPIYGRGMWSTIFGFLSLGPDISSVAGVRFYEHGETPGIGDRIQSPAWTAQWVGKRVYAEDGTFMFRIGSGDGDGAFFERVDSITGATVTVSAIDKFVRYWLGNDGYGPFLENLRLEAD